MSTYYKHIASITITYRTSRLQQCYRKVCWLKEDSVTWHCTFCSGATQRALPHTSVSAQKWVLMRLKPGINTHLMKDHELQTCAMEAITLGHVYCTPWYLFFSIFYLFFYIIIELVTEFITWDLFLFYNFVFNLQFFICL